MASTTTAAAPGEYRGTDKLIFGIVLAVVTFWLFAQTTLNVAPTMRQELRISESLINIAVSITALFSGIFIVVAGNLADRLGRVKLTYAGLALGVLGSLLIALSPAGTAGFLMAGRIVQGLSAACIMPATLALMKAYLDGRERQRALSYWSIGSWGGVRRGDLRGSLHVAWRSGCQFRASLRPFSGEDRQRRHPFRGGRRPAVQRADGGRRHHRHRDDRALG
jgi:MFS transporter, DHA2 family, multidrug resistance protein